MNIEPIHSPIVESVTSLPLILALNSGGEALGWIDYEKSAFYYSKNKVKWALGSYEVTLRGGTNAKTGQQSILTMDTIIAIDSNISRSKFRGRRSPVLTNKTLFVRDVNICGYCGSEFKKASLTRDHVIPKVQGGKDIWENVVTACFHCNQKKGGRTPEEANMPLLYVPYAPSHNEHLILQNRRILACQMDYLMKGVAKESRLRLEGTLKH